MEKDFAAVAILAAAGGDEAELAQHIRTALRHGVAASELLALCEQVAAQVGDSSTLDRVLSEMDIPRPPATHRVQLADHETLVAQAGSAGPAVVLLHALGLDWHMWEPVLAPLSAGRRVFAYDIRGHGSAAGSPSPFTMADTATDLLGVLDAFELDRAHVVGLSYGGGIAQTAAVAYPARFASLSLLATTDYPFDAFESRARSAETDGMAAQVIPSLTRWFTPEALATNEWGVRYARNMVLGGNVTDWAAAWRAFIGLDVQNRLASFDAPTLILAGERDASTTPEIMTAIANRIPGAIYKELPGTPHMHTLERPELVVTALDEFLPAGDA